MMPSIGLSILELEILRSNDWINDTIIYAAQKLLKQHFPSINGFQSTLYSNNLKFRVLPLDDKYVQILHADCNHWITVSNIDTNTNKGVRNRALIYDSLVPRKPSYNVKQQICSFLRPLANSFIFDILNIMPQPNSYDCGVIAIANATELLFGNNPAKCVWDVSKMREHLIQCFQQQKITRFPILRERRIPFGHSVKNFVIEDIHCTCRMPEDHSKSMIECSMCKKWFHGACIGLEGLENYTDKKWFCSKCDCMLS